MCGIAALLSPAALNANDVNKLRQMVSCMKHRGPDDEGYALGGTGWMRPFGGDDTVVHLPRIDGADLSIEAHVALGHRRLSIIDLTSAGHQPMIDDGRSNAVVFAGEIYNYVEIRQELVARGYVFNSNSDTEVLLNSWSEWGSSCVERFDGMWAFCLWSARDQALYASRDRIGEKQLYYTQLQQGAWALSSEVKPLLECGASTAPDPGALWDFLCLGLTDHTAETAFASIRQVEPGTVVRLSVGSPPYVMKYYQLRQRSAPGGDLVSIRKSIQDSVRLRLRGEVPVSAFLSGGLDSSSVVAIADAVRSEEGSGTESTRITAFTRTYVGARLEEPFIESLLPRLKNVDWVPLPADRRRIEDDLDGLVRLQELPFSTLAIHASYDLFREVSQRTSTKVVLVGDGGDEIFGGYPRVYASYALRDSFRRGVSTGLTAFSSMTTKQAIESVAKMALRAVPTGLRLKVMHRVLTGMLVMKKDFFADHIERFQAIDRTRGSSSLRERLMADVSFYNLPQLLRYLDRNSMHFGIEARSPLLSHKVAEEAFTGEARDFDGYVGKRRLREAMRGTLPTEILVRKDKAGFGAFEQFWLEVALKRLADSQEIREYIDTARVERLAKRLANTTKGGSGRYQELWFAIAVALWLESFRASNAINKGRP